MTLHDRKACKVEFGYRWETIRQPLQTGSLSDMPIFCPKIWFSKFVLFYNLIDFELIYNFAQHCEAGNGRFRVEKYTPSYEIGVYFKKFLWLCGMIIFYDFLLTTFFILIATDTGPGTKKTKSKHLLTWG